MNNINFKKDDLVEVTNDGHVYISYSQFIKRHLQYAIRWVYKECPNKEHIFKIRGIYNHCMENKYDKNTKCIVIEDLDTKQIYLVGELALRKYIPHKNQEGEYK